MDGSSRLSFSDSENSVNDDETSPSAAAVGFLDMMVEEAEIGVGKATGAAVVVLDAMRETARSRGRLDSAGTIAISPTPERVEVVYMKSAIRGERASCRRNDSGQAERGDNNCTYKRS